MTAWTRVVAHADMDAFYASVEQLDDPALRGRPILVGHPEGRGVVLTASYEARPFGVGSAMPMALARRKCPQALIVPPRFARYTEVSRAVMAAFRDFSHTVEAISLDEAFLEMTGTERLFGTPGVMGRRIKDAVRAATGGLTASVGISSTKYVAKVASAFRKPDGLTVVHPDHARAFLAPLPVRKLWGVGPKTEERLAEKGYLTVGQLADEDDAVLRERLGNAGPQLGRLARAEDPRHVQGARRAVSVGSERTLAADVSDRATIEEHLRTSAETIGHRLRQQGVLASGVRVKLKTADFRSISRQTVLPEPTDVGRTLYEAGLPLLDQFPWETPFRLIGMAAYALVREGEPTQLGLFDVRAAKRRRLEAAMDAVRARHGSGALLRAEDLGKPRRDGPILDAVDEELAAAQDETWWEADEDGAT